MKTVYVAGPMSGIPFFNFPAFDRARDVLLLNGYGVISPADMDREAGFDPWTFCDEPEKWDWSVLPLGLDVAAMMDRDIAGVRRCDAILLLPGWTYSKGARVERAIAEWCGKEVWFDIKPREVRP